MGILDTMAKPKKTPRDARIQVPLKFASAADVEELRRYADKWMDGNLALYLRTCARLVHKAGGPWARFERQAVELPEKKKEKRR